MKTPALADAQLGITCFRSATDTHGTTGRTTWPAFVEKLRTPPEYTSKSASPLIKLAVYGDKPNANGSLRHNANVSKVYGIEGDYDGGLISPAEAAARLRAAGVIAIVYTTASHTPERPRWRALVPLSRPHAPRERAALVDRLNGALGGVLAPESWTLAQAFYVGRVAGVPYEFHEVEGAPLDELIEVGAAPDPIGKPGTAGTDGKPAPLARGAVATDAPAPLGLSLCAIREALRWLSPDDYAAYGDWLQVGQALHHELGGDPAGMGIWAEFSSAMSNYDARELQDKWKSFGTYSGPPVTMRSLVKTANAARREAEAASDFTTPGGETQGQVIARLAALPLLDYERVREREAAALGVRVSTLDTEVKRLRTADADDDGTGGALVLEPPEPWPQPVDGAALVDELVATLREYVVCNPPVADTAALWIVFTWFIDAVHVAPIANITAPLPDCGKSTLLDFMEQLCFLPLKSDGISSAALFRTMDKWHPTLLLDEVDAFLRDNEDARGILNSGHKRNGFIIRLVGDEHEPTRFNTWGAKALCGIGAIADTLRSRSIRLELRRKLPRERVNNLRHIDSQLVTRLTRQLCRLRADLSAKVKQARPTPVEGMGNRAADNWEPLLQVADSIGGDWPERARNAAMAAIESPEKDEAASIMLLEDMRALFDLKGDRLRSEDLLHALWDYDHRPWPEWRSGRAITQRNVAQLLKPFKISPSTLRIGQWTGKGYRKEQFSDAFARYLPFLPSTPSPSVTPSQVNGSAGFSEFSIRHTAPHVTDEKRRKPAPRKGCDGVTDKSPLPWEREHMGLK